MLALKLATIPTDQVDSYAHVWGLLTSTLVLCACSHPATQPVQQPAMQLAGGCSAKHMRATWEQPSV